MRVKICGITNLNDALLCSQLGADALGFIFYEKSERNITYSKAEEIIKQLPPFIVKVGVFVDKKADEINAISQKVGLNAVQLYGEVAQSFIDDINFPVIKCFRVKNGFDFSVLNNYYNCSFLLDSFSEKVLGGTGKSFEWNCIPDEFRDKIVLAGGISSDNIEHIFKEIKPAAVDLSSSVELFPGKKDAYKLKKFFNMINKLRYS
jgi:phosphoribosylanthranilate isomerase